MEPVKPVVLPELPEVDFKIGEAVGIENVKVILADAFTLAAAAAQLVKKFDIAPLLTIATIFGRYGQNIGETFQAALTEIKDLDEAEAAELVAEVKEAFDIADDVLEAKIEALLDLPLISYVEVKDAVELVAVLIKVLKDEETTISEKLRELADLIPDLIEQGGDLVAVVEQWIDAIKALAPPKDENQ